MVLCGQLDVWLLNKEVVGGSVVSGHKGGVEKVLQPIRSKFDMSDNEK